MLLAELLPHALPADDGELLDSGDVALVGEHLGQHLGRAELRVGAHHRVESVLDEAHPLVRERPDGVLAAGLAQEAQRLDRQVVVLLVEALAAPLGEREHLGRPASTALGGASRLAGLHRSLRNQLVEVAAYGGRRKVQSLAERRSGGGTLDEDRPGHAMPRRLVVLEYHNTSVPLIVSGLQGRSPLLAPI